MTQHDELPQPTLLKFALRGPELAVALPKGDVDALLEVLGELDGLWNGRGTLLMPVDDDGRVHFERWLGITVPDRIYVHERVASEIDAKLASHGQTVRRLGSVRAGEEIDRLDVVDPDALPPTIRHLPASMRDHAFSRVVLGRLTEAEATYLKKDRQLEEVPVAEARHELVRSQVAGDSPWAWSATLMDHSGAVNVPTQTRTLVVLADEPTFDELVWFWNLRARRLTHNGELAVLAVNTSDLSDAGALTQVRRWATGWPAGSRPQFFVDVPEADAARVVELLDNADMKQVEPRETFYSRVPAEREGLEFAVAAGRVGGTIPRGLASDQLVRLQYGDNPLVLPLPERFPARLAWAGRVHLDFEGLPLEFPLSNQLADACYRDAEARGGRISQGILVAGRDLRLSLRLPPISEQFSRHMDSRGLRGHLSDAGRIAQTFLARFGSTQVLDAAGAELAPAVLQSLVVDNRLKLAQRVSNEVAKSGALVDADELARRIQAESAFLEIPARTLNGLSAELGRPKKEVARALGPMVTHGLVHRGREVRCPECQLRDYWSLHELDERLPCRFCSHQFSLPAIEGDQEVPLSYRLDGVTARAINNDLLSVFLTLRGLQTTPHINRSGVYWPGLNLLEPEAREPFAEIDLLFASNGRLFAAECKTRAASLSLEEANRHLGLAERLGAEPVFGALDSDWSQEVVELCAEADASVFTGGQPYQARPKIARE